MFLFGSGRHTIRSADNRYDACRFLLEQMTFHDLHQLWNRLGLTTKIQPKESKPQVIMQILENTDLELLSKSVAP